MNAKNLARARFARTSAEGGGGGQPDQQTGGAGTEGNQQTGQQQTQTGPVEATDEAGVPLGFPKDTPVAQMKAEEQAAYWRNEAKKANKRAPSNLTELQAAAAKWEEYQRTQQTPAEQQIAQAREQAAAAARKEAAVDATDSLLRVTLQARGKTATEIDEILDPIDPAKFLTAEGKPDTGKVLAFADKLAPAGPGGGGFGQGRGFGAPPQSKSEAGRLEAQRRFVKQSAPPVAK